MTNKSTANSSVVQTILNRQYVYGPIGGGSISGNVKGQLRGLESNAAMDATAAIHIRIVKPDGTDRGTLLAITAAALNASNEYPTGTAANRNTLVSTALSAVSAVNGDYLVIEIGCKQNSASANRSVTHVYGDNSATDLPEDQTTTATNNPWIEFSGAIADFTELIPGVVAMAVTGFIAALTLAIVPGAGSMAITGAAPTVASGTAVTPGPAALSLTGYAPILQTTLTASQAALTLTGYIPVLTLTLTPDKAALSVSGKTPNVGGGVLNRYQFFNDGLESHALAVANDGLRHVPFQGRVSAFLSTPDTVPSSVSAGFGVVALVRGDANTNVGAGPLIAKWGAAGNRAFIVQAQIASGNFKIAISLSALGTTSVTSTQTANFFVLGDQCWIKILCDADDGAGNRVVSIYRAPFNGTTDIPSAWDLVEVITTAGATSIFDSSADVTIGAGSTGQFAGLIRRVLFYDASNSLVHDCHPNADAADGDTSWTAVTGEVWTANGTADLQGEVTVPDMTLNAPLNALLRCRVQEFAGVNLTLGDWQLLVQVGGVGTYDPVPSSGAVVTSHSSPTLTDGGATASRLTAGTGSFVAGKVSEDGLADSLQLTASNYTELLFSIRIDPQYLSLGNTTLRFRLLLNNSTVDTSNTPTITIRKKAILLTPDLATLALLGYAPDVDDGAGGTTDLVPDVATLAVSGSAPTLTLALTPDAGSVGVSGYAPVLTETVTPGAAAASVTGYAPTIQFITALVPDAATLSVAGYAPQLSETLTPDAGSVAVTGYAPSVVSAITLTPAPSTLTVSGYAPTLTFTIVLIPDPAESAVTGYAPSLSETLTPDAGTITVTGYAPAAGTTFILTPATATLSIAGHAPHLTLELTPGSDTLVITGIAPTARLTIVITPDNGEMAVTGYAPDTHVSEVTYVVPDTATITTTGYAAQLLESATPAKATVAITGHAPVLSLTLTMTDASLAITCYAPSVDQIVPIVPDAASILIATAAPTVFVFRMVVYVTIEPLESEVRFAPMDATAHFSNLAAVARLTPGPTVAENQAAEPLTILKPIPTLAEIKEY